MRRLLFYVFYGIAIGVFLFILAAFTGLPVLGEVIYDNSLSPHYNHTTGKVDFVTGPEMGDEITLGGTSRIVTQFDLALFVTNPIPTGEIHFYANDGSGGAPSTLLYDSGSINLIDGANSLTGLSVTVPDTLTRTSIICRPQSMGLSSVCRYTTLRPSAPQVETFLGKVYGWMD